MLVLEQKTVVFVEEDKYKEYLCRGSTHDPLISLALQRNYLFAVEEGMNSGVQGKVNT